MSIGRGQSYRNFYLARLEVDLGWVRKSALKHAPDFPGNERGNEPSQAYRQDLTQRADAIYMNLRTTSDSPEAGVSQLAANVGRGAESP